MVDDARSRSVDVIARLAESWDGIGRNALTAPIEHQALLCIAHLPTILHVRRWNDLTGDERSKLLTAARRAVELGKLCAWFFGEAYGGAAAQVLVERTRIRELEVQLAEAHRQLAAAHDLIERAAFGSQ